MPRATKISLDDVQLERGDHSSPEQGMCIMELAAYLSPTSPFSDHPPCVSPVIGAFLRNWNDSLDDEPRQMLKPYAVKILDTATGTADDAERAWLATDWLVRECAPAFLRVAGLLEHAETMAALAPVIDAKSAASASAAGAAARAAARAAAGAAARAAAGDAAGDAAWAAAGAAAWAAAGDAAWAAAGAAAGDAAGAAAGDAAWAAAWAAAGDAAWAAAGAAAWAAAGDALEPTVTALQPTALSLLDRMIAVGKT